MVDKISGKANNIGMIETVNSKKRKAPPKAWKKGQSGNPAGGPKRGESWGEIIKYVSHLSPSEVNELLRRKSGVDMKTIATLKMFKVLCAKSNPKIFKELADRGEGKVADKVELKSTSDVSVLSNLADVQIMAIINRTPAPQPLPEAPNGVEPAPSAP